MKPDIIKLLIIGAINRDHIRKRMENKKGRLLVLPSMLTTLRNPLNLPNISFSNIRLMWLVVTWCSSGAFKVHKILSRE